jgi:hypothetical protein
MTDGLDRLVGEPRVLIVEQVHESGQCRRVADFEQAANGHATLAHILVRKALEFDAQHGTRTEGGNTPV